MAVMQESTTDPGAAQPTPPGGPANALGGASLALGLFVGAAVIVFFAAMLIARRWAMGRRPAREAISVRPDPWFEAGRRLQVPDEPGPGAGADS